MGIIHFDLPISTCHFFLYFVLPPGIISLFLSCFLLVQNCSVYVIMLFSPLITHSACNTQGYYAAEPSSVSLRRRASQFLAILIDSIFVFLSPWKCLYYFCFSLHFRASLPVSFVARISLKKLFLHATQITQLMQYLPQQADVKSPMERVVNLTGTQDKENAKRNL